MSDKRIKVAGYSQRIQYTDGIEYRPFSPDLVGLQLATENSAPLFTMGNFNITTNMDPKVDKTFVTKDFSDFVSLSDLDLTVETNNIFIDNNNAVNLNIDSSKLKNYALFGSLNEFVRVSLENIIITWPAALFVQPIYLDDFGNTQFKPTFEDLTYDSLRNESSFKIDVNLLENKYGINYLANGTLANTFSETNNVRNLAINYAGYVILVNGIDYEVLNFTGATTLIDDYIYFNVKGQIFSGTPSIVEYHIKPNNTAVEVFFKSLNKFEEYLLNRSTMPQYKATFNFPTKSDSGIILYTSETIIWPVSDGYNIDFDSGEYISYVSELLKITDNHDLYESNLMNRFLVSESITSFDTIPLVLTDEELDNSGQKVNKLLNIYGRSFDDINNFISGIEFANVVSYDKKDNTPDNYVKNLAKVLGWDVTTAINNPDILSNFLTPSNSTYSGRSIGLTAAQADIELWRRLILNSPWIWKSKGARKSVEFLLRFIGTPSGLVELNEYVYKADGPIDVELFSQALDLNGLPANLEDYPIDDDGYPNFTGNTNEMYFQSNGLWYRETGGANAIIDIATGNNPHVGPYDGGNKYLNQFRTLIPDFSAVTIHNETSATTNTNLFTNYNVGKITNYSGATYVDVLNNDNTDLTDCVVVTSTIMADYKPTEEITDCGCVSSSDDDILSVCIKKIVKPEPQPCNELAKPPVKDDMNGNFIFSHYQYNADGTTFKINGTPVLKESIFTSRECCKSNHGISTYTDNLNPNNNELTSGYACCFTNKCGCSLACNWIMNQTTYKYPTNGTGQYCEFTTLFGGGTKKVTLPDASNCPSVWTVAVPNITDPYTGDVGFGCKLTSTGLTEIDKVIDYYKKKADGGYGTKTCCLFTREIYLQYFPKG